jgi:scyllo-inositol 2-dehydrogenase (NADP+)
LRLSKVVTSRRDQVSKDLEGVAAVPAINNVFDDPFIDLAVIASPSANHFEHATAALLAGKHVWSTSLSPPRRERRTN